MSSSAQPGEAASDAQQPSAPQVWVDPATRLVQTDFKAWLSDPHGTFRAARALGPLLGFANGRGVLALRAEHVIPLMSDPRARQIGPEIAQYSGADIDGAYFHFAQNTLLFAHGKTHQKRRRAIAKSFHFSLMEALRAEVRATADALAASLPEDAPFDLRDAFAAALPARVIAKILGLPEADIPDFTARVYAMSGGLAFSVLDEDWPSIDHGAQALTEYVQRLFAERRAAPRDDFLTRYLAMADAAGELSPDETLQQIVTLILGGADTTRGAMTILVDLLLAHRDQWQAVVADQSLAPGAVGEALRFEPSVGSVGVIPLETIEVGGIPVPPGMPLGLSTMSAMRDPEVYADPDRFDITRTDIPRLHPVFGGGPHRCLGEALAKVELEEGLKAIAARFPDLRADGPRLRVSGVGGIRKVGKLLLRGA
ncbi:MAG: cytochrome P450 [Pseudomonadota bacterium]